jgi:hypothetical protein
LETGLKDHQAEWALVESVKINPEETLEFYFSDKGWYHVMIFLVYSIASKKSQ